MPELNKSKNETKKLISVRIILKSGAEVHVTCSEFTLNERNNEIYRYEIEGIVGNRPMYVSMDEIAAVQIIDK